MERFALPWKMSRSVIAASTRVIVAPPVREAMSSERMSRVTLREMRLPLIESAESSVVTVSIIPPEAEDETLPAAMSSPF